MKPADITRKGTCTVQLGTSCHIRNFGLGECTLVSKKMFTKLCEKDTCILERNNLDDDCSKH